MNYVLREGDRVKFNISYNMSGIGTIRGIASVPAAIIGAIYIIEPDERIPGWEYSCIVCPEVQISKLTEIV